MTDRITDAVTQPNVKVFEWEHIELDHIWGEAFPREFRYRIVFPTYDEFLYLKTINEKNCTECANGIIKMTDAELEKLVKEKVEIEQYMNTYGRSIEELTSLMRLTMICLSLF